MDFFSIANLVTLFVVAVVLIIFRLTDRKNRNIEAAHAYGKQLEEHLKKHVSQYIEKKKADITNYGALLAADKSAAKALLSNIEAKINEFKIRTDTLDQVQQRLNTYDSSLNELFKMTARVEENLQRIAVESEFVENTAVQINGAKEKYEAFLNSIMEGRKQIEDNAEESLKKIELYINDSKNQLHTDIERAEKERTANIERDTTLINTMLKEAVDNAGERAGKVEDEIYQEFRKQTEERAARIKDELTKELEKLRSHNQNEVTALGKEMAAEMQDLEDNAEDLRLSAAEIDTLKKNINTSITEVNATLETYKQRADDAAAALKNELSGLAESAKNAALETAKEKFNEYKTAEAALVHQLTSGMDSARAMDAELRLQLESIQENIKKQINTYEEESLATGEKIIAETNNAIAIQKEKLREIETEIEKIKKESYERTEENLRFFEDDFANSLNRRSESLETRFVEWRDAANNRLNTITENQEAESRKIEVNFGETLRKKTAELDTKFISELERIKNAAAALEDGTHKQMEDAEGTLASLREQIKGDFTELRESSLAALNTEISRSSLETADKLKNFFRDVENEQKLIKERVEEKNSEITAQLLKSRKEVEDALAALHTNIKETHTHIEDLQRRGKEALAENENKINAAKNSIEEINTEIEHYKQDMFSSTEQKSKTLEISILGVEEKINDFFEQSKIIDKTIEMKNELNRSIEDIRDDLQRLELQKADLANLESQFAKIKRMEDDVNAKMSRFLTEQRRIDLMEEDFKKLLHTAAAVDEKLVSLTENNDMLQEMQLKFRKLSEAMTETEEKYQRIEKKNQILDATNEGIDKNFKSLQESEKTAKQFVSTVDHLSAELTEIRIAVDNLANETVKVVETSKKLEELDTTLGEIEKRITDMRQARQWLADLEGRLDKVYAEAKDQVKLAGDLLKEKGTRVSGESGAPTIAQREKVFDLTHRGWKPDEIARNLHLSRAAVELILEAPPRER